MKDDITRLQQKTIIAVASLFGNEEALRKVLSFARKLRKEIEKEEKEKQGKGE